MNILEIMDRESCGKSEIYLYEEKKKWYAYDRSADLLNHLNDKTVTLKKESYPFYGIPLNKIEVNLEQLLDHDWLVILCADQEMTLIQNN